MVGHAEHKEGGSIPEGEEDGPFAVGNALRFLWGCGWWSGRWRCVGGVGGGADSGAHAAGGLSAAPAVTATRTRIVVVDEFACSGVGRQDRRVEGG